MIDIWLSQLCYRPTYLKLTLFSISNLVIIAFKLFQVEEEKKKEFRDSFLKTYKNGMINNDVTVWIHSSEKEKKSLLEEKAENVLSFRYLEGLRVSHSVQRQNANKTKDIKSR